MSYAEDFKKYEEVVVDEALAAELSRRGVRSSLHLGDIVRLQIIHPESESEPLRDFGDFVGGMSAGPDYAQRTDETLGEGFGKA